MKYKQILIIILLLCLSIISYLFIQKKSKMTTVQSDLNKSIKKIDIPKIIIPKKSMEFTINKNEDGNISFIGTFSIPETAKNIAKLLDTNRLKYQIKIDNKREDVNETLLLIGKVLKRFTENYINWSIVYKDRKILVSGETISSKDKDSLERLLNLSSLNIFTNIKVVKKRNEALDVISNLKLVVDKEESKQEDNLSEDDIEDILLNLKSLAIEEFRIEKKNIKKHIKKREVKQKKVIVKKKKTVAKKKKPVLITKKRVIPKKVKEKKIVIKKIEKIKLKEKIVKRIEPKPTIDIMSLPFIKPLNSVEDVKYLKTKKPLVKEETIYIKSDKNKIDKNIPWAKLHDINEKVNGVFIPEVVNQP